MAQGTKLTAATTGVALFGIYATLTYQTYSAQKDDPLPPELWLGHGQAVALGAIASYESKSYWPLLGTLVVSGLMHCAYVRKVNGSGSNWLVEG